MAQQTINIGTTANDGTGDPLRTAFDKVNDNFTELYNDDAGDVNSVNGQTGAVTLDSDDITQGSTNLYNQTHTGDVTGSTALTIANDVVGHDQLANRYTLTTTISSNSSPINLDASSYAGFNLTGTLGTVTIDVQNIKEGQVIDIVLSGDLSGATITLSASTFTSATINKVGTSSLDTSTTNIIQVLCVDDNDAGAILHWAVASYASGTSV